MADVLDVTGDEIRELPQLAWIERDMRSGKVSRGKVSFLGTKAELCYSVIHDNQCTT